jgi:hypothetical protein
VFSEVSVLEEAVLEEAAAASEIPSSWPTLLPVAGAVTSCPKGIKSLKVSESSMLQFSMLHPPGGKTGNGGEGSCRGAITRGGAKSPKTVDGLPPDAGSLEMLDAKYSSSEPNSLGVLALLGIGTVDSFTVTDIAS